LLTEDLIDYWISEPKLCKHFHIPLQSGNDTILASMKRRYRTDLYSKRIEKIKAVCPDAGIGADVLVGFPGETPDLFEQSYRFLRELPLSYLHTFTYSERPRTSAAQFQGRIEPRERAERSERLRMLGIRKRRMFHESFIGKSVDVLFEQAQEEGRWSGFTVHYVRVSAKSGQSIANEIHRVEILQANNENCIGELTVNRDGNLQMQLSQSA
jgi:threonylcarbamoyladenosine tRNA methylthiotransferase MtaB